MKPLRLLALVAPISVWAGPADVPSPLSSPLALLAQASPSDPPSAAGDAGDTQLDAVRADHLIRFLNYVNFPGTSVPPPGEPYVIGVAGAEEVFQALGAMLAGRTLHSRPLTRRLISDGDALTGVHLLYLGRRIDVPNHPLARAARSLPVLLVCEHPEGLASGAVFNFVFVRDQLRFEASLAAADRAGLVVSSRLLALADRVVGGR